MGCCGNIDYVLLAHRCDHRLERSSPNVKTKSGTHHTYHQTLNQAPRTPSSPISATFSFPYSCVEKNALILLAEVSSKWFSRDNLASIRRQKRHFNINEKEQEDLALLWVEIASNVLGLGRWGHTHMPDEKKTPS